MPATIRSRSAMQIKCKFTLILNEVIPTDIYIQLCYMTNICCNAKSIWVSGKGRGSGLGCGKHMQIKNPPQNKCKWLRAGAGPNWKSIWVSWQGVNSETWGSKSNCECLGASTLLTERPRPLPTTIPRVARKKKWAFREAPSPTSMGPQCPPVVFPPPPWDAL